MNVNIFKIWHWQYEGSGQLRELQTSFDDFSLHFLNIFPLILLMTILFSLSHSLSRDIDEHRINIFCLWRCHKSDEQWIEIDVHSCFVHRFSHIFHVTIFYCKKFKTNAKIDAFVSLSIVIALLLASEILYFIFKMLRVMEMIVEDLNN